MRPGRSRRTPTNPPRFQGPVRARAHIEGPVLKRSQGHPVPVRDPMDPSSSDRRRRPHGRTTSTPGRPLAAAVGTVLLASLVVAGMAPPAAATHLPNKVDRCTYEVGPGYHLEYTTDDPTGLTSDGTLNQGGCLWEFSDSAQSPPTSAIEGQREVSGEYSRFQLALVDDVFGPELGASACMDIDNNRICGEDEKGEIGFTFCGTSGVHGDEIGDTDGDGHPDLGSNLMLFLNGPRRQALNCDATANPVGATTGGILDPAGGIFLTLSG